MIVHDFSNAIQRSSDFKYKDIKLSETTNITGQVDINAITTSLRNLFDWEVGSRIRLPEYGLNLRKFLYEPINRLTADRIGREIEVGLGTWEPRIKVINIFIEPFPDDYQFDIEIQYSIPSLPSEEMLVFKKVLV